MKTKLGVILFLLSHVNITTARILHYGSKIGLSFSIGTKINRIGIMAGAYFINYPLQFNFVSHSFYCFNTYGSAKKHWEFQHTLTLKALFGGSFLNSTPLSLFTSSSNNSNQKYSIGYGLKYYYDNIKTTQLTGVLDVTIKNISFITENDAFVFNAWDRYRTGALQINYIHSFKMQNLFYYTRYGFAIHMYTPSVRDKNALRIKNTTYPARYGYIDLQNAYLGNCSHGIATFYVEQALPYSQSIFFNMGVDDERIRHLFQNKLLHDMPFIPKKWNKPQNPHIPMLTKQGNPYLFSKNDTLKPTKLFLHIGASNTLFY